MSMGTDPPALYSASGQPAPFDIFDADVAGAPVSAGAQLLTRINQTRTPVSKGALLLTRINQVRTQSAPYGSGLCLQTPQGVGRNRSQKTPFQVNARL